ncbi:MAG: hypothetical protein OHK0015_49470 [Chloroflexi bacterium OHK40]
MTLHAQGVAVGSQGAARARERPPARVGHAGAGGRPVREARVPRERGGRGSGWRGNDSTRNSKSVWSNAGFRHKPPGTRGAGFRLAYGARFRNRVCRMFQHPCALSPCPPGRL